MCFFLTLFWLEKGQNYDSAQRVDLHEWGNWRWAEPWTLNLRMPAQNFRPLKDFDIKKEEMNMWFPGLFCLLTMFSLPVQSQAKPFVKHFQTSWQLITDHFCFFRFTFSFVNCSLFQFYMFYFFLKEELVGQLISFDSNGLLSPVYFSAFYFLLSEELLVDQFRIDHWTKSRHCYRWN